METSVTPRLKATEVRDLINGNVKTFQEEDAKAKKDAMEAIEKRFRENHAKYLKSITEYIETEINSAITASRTNGEYSRFVSTQFYQFESDHTDTLKGYDYMADNEFTFTYKLHDRIYRFKMNPFEKFGLEPINTIIFKEYDESRGFNYRLVDWEQIMFGTKKTLHYINLYWE